jgi:hypothetical protein
MAIAAALNPIAILLITNDDAFLSGSTPAFANQTC